MKTTTLEKQILEKIKEQGLRPTSRGYFYVREITIWLFFSIFVVAMSLGFAMIMFMIRGTDFGLFEKLGLSSGQKIIYSIPFFWIVTSATVAAAAFINFRNTRRGYKMSARQFGFIASLIALALGSILYSMDVTEYVDKKASEKIPLYNSIVPLNTNAWLDPAHGLLSGVVRDRESESDFFLRDANGVLWHVTGKNIKMPEDFIWASGDRIKLIGRETGLDEFQAIEILPWEDRPRRE